MFVLDASGSQKKINVKEYLCQIWPWIYCVCGNHNPALSSFMTSQVIVVAGTAYPSGASEHRFDFYEVRVPQSLVFCVAL